MRHGLAFLAILALVAAALWFDFSPRVPVREGLDLKGGMRVTLEADQAQIRDRHLSVTVDTETMGRVREILENRVNAFGLSGTTVQVKGDRQIVATLPGARNPEQALSQLQKVALLEFRWLKDAESQDNPSARYKMNRIPGDSKTPEQYTFTDAQTGKPVPQQVVLDSSPLILAGKDLLPKSSQGINTQGAAAEPVVNFRFNAQGASVFAAFTEKHVHDYLAIVLDGVIISAPTIREPITEGHGEISGGFRTIAEARNLAALLNSGSLPVPLKVVETQTVGATLGTEAIHRSILAGALGLVLVLVFMVAYYVLPGVLADIALLFYAAITFAIFKVFGVVLDLPGITGFILSVGMAVDANILIFERLREEMRAGKTLHAAIDAGFNRAFTSIFDSNVTTWIVCGVLFSLGAPIIKGFALTLAIGVAVSMFTAITVTRTMLHLVVNFPWARSERAFGLGISWLSNRFTEGRALDVYGKRKYYFGFSIALLAVGLAFLAMGGLRPGIDFTGGSEVQATYREPVTTDQVNDVLRKDGIRGAQVTRGTSTLVWTTATANVNSELSLTAKDDVKARLEQLKGFDDASYRETTAPGGKGVTATAVYITSQKGYSKKEINDALAGSVTIGTGAQQRTLATLPSFTVQTNTETKSNLPVIFITSRHIGDEQARRLDRDLMGLAGGYIRPAYTRETIGPSIASEVTLNAFTSVVVASLLIIAYLTLRFAIGGFMNGVKFGVCAVVAQIHDILTVTGIFALMGILLGWQVDSLFVTAALTIIGFSVHDTIVVYDRIRENLRNRLRGETFEGVANRSMTQTFDRSINTSFTVLLVLLALYIWGGQPIKLFNVALLIGIAIGTYSSVFVASPLVVLWQKMSERASGAAKREDVRLAGGGAPARRPASRPTPPARPKPEASPRPRVEAVNGDGEVAGVGAPRPASPTAPRPTAGAGTIRPKRKRRS